MPLASIHTQACPASSTPTSEHFLRLSIVSPAPFAPYAASFASPFKVLAEPGTLRAS